MFSIEDPLATEAIFRLNGLEKQAELPNGKVAAKVAAFNSQGSGPFSDSATIELDIHGHTLYYNEYSHQNTRQYTWLIALLGSVAFMLILLSSVMIYYRKRPKYLPTSTTSDSDNYHCTLKGAADGPLWIDRYFEKESSSAKLLSVSATMPNVKDSEYAYIGNGLLLFHSLNDIGNYPKLSRNIIGNPLAIQANFRVNGL